MTSLDWTPQYCDDEAFVPAPPQRVFDALLDVASWNRWWETMRFTPERDGPSVFGDRIVFDGIVSKWNVEVTAIEPPRSIRYRYADGALTGDTEWRVTPVAGGALVAYVYHGVVAQEERAATTFGRFGTSLHTMVMQADALDGLRRLMAGEPLDEAWRQAVRARVAEGRAALIAMEERA